MGWTWYRSARGVLLVAGVWGALGAGAAWACSFAGPPIVDGLLGLTFETLDFGTPSAARLPRNVASLAAIGVSQGGAIATVPVPGSSFAGLRTPETLLDPGTVLTAPGPGSAGVAEVGDAIDDTPPARPEIVGGALDVYEQDDRVIDCGLSFDSCGDFAQLRVQVAPTADDLAPQNRITYALFLGRSAEQASETDIVDDFFAPDLEGGFWRFASVDDRDDPIWATVVALDQAGNESERSDPFPLNTPDGGCRVEGRSPVAALWPVAAALLLALPRRRPRRRAPRA